MTKEEKELLLKDLCARLPYEVKVLYLRDFNHDWYNLEKVDIGDNELYVTTYESYENKYVKVEDALPYLFTLSSMTEEQKRDLTNLFNCTVVITEWEIIFPNYYDSNMDNWNKAFNWCYKNHFDCNGLIPLGLAIDATNLNIY